MKPLHTGDLDDELRAAVDADDADLIESLGAAIDDLERLHPRTTTCLQAALWYAEVGLKVFPLAAGSKIPLRGSRGCLEATSDPEVIRQWWDDCPESNVAIATGHLVDVIDIDGPAANPSLLHLLDDLPTILGRVSTPRAGGRHLYVAAVAGHGNKAAMMTGIDYRGAGGYVVAPPSATEQGQYVWTRPLVLP